MKKPDEKKPADTESREEKRAVNKRKSAIKIIGIAVLVLAVALAAIFVFPRAVMAPEPKETPAPTEVTEVTDVVETLGSEVEPSSTLRVDYVPDPDELQEMPAISELELTEGYITHSLQKGLLNVSWPAVPDAAYYVLCVLDSSGAALQQDILKAEITEWEIPEFQGDSVLLLCYQDMGEDSAEDDELIGSYVVYFKSEATPTPKPSGKASPTASSKPKYKYMIIVDKADHAFAAFTYDDKGEYTKKVVTYPCALGRSSRMTPTGTFKISNKGRWKAWSGDEFSPYYTRYTSGLYFHGPIYDEKDGGTMIKKSYEEIGTNASAGCVRTTTAGAYWVYANCPAGTSVKIVKTSDIVSWPGKPAIDPDYPKWDPTDPNKPSGPKETASPSPSPSASAKESEAPTEKPTETPTKEPTDPPTEKPTDDPSPTETVTEQPADTTSATQAWAMLRLKQIFTQYSKINV